jgi:hypothetical protein
VRKKGVDIRRYQRLFPAPYPVHTVAATRRNALNTNDKTNDKTEWRKVEKGKGKERPQIDRESASCAPRLGALSCCRQARAWRQRRASQYVSFFFVTLQAKEFRPSLSHAKPRRVQEPKLSARRQSTHPVVLVLSALCRFERA